MNNNNNKYLWANLGDQRNQKQYVYLNEKNEEIIGNTVYDSDKESPYSCNSIYQASICIGQACHYVRTINPKNDYHVIKV